jgi:hypothetical protein
MYEMKFFSSTSWLNRVSLKKTHLSGKQNVQTIQQIPKSFDTLRGLKFELCLSLTQVEKYIKLYLFSSLMMQCLFLSSSFRQVQCLQKEPTHIMLHNEVFPKILMILLYQHGRDEQMKAIKQDRMVWSGTRSQFLWYKMDFEILT